MDIKLYFEQTKTIINPKIHKCIYVLMKCLFFGKQNIKRDSIKKLEHFIKIWKGKNINFNLDFNSKPSEENFMVIMDFIRSQNYLFAGEIMENIIVRLFNFAFRAPEDAYFGKYIYNNLKFLKNEKQFIIRCFNNDLLNQLFEDPSNCLRGFMNDDNQSKKDPFIQLLFKIEVFKKTLINRKKNEVDNYEDTSTKYGDYTSIYDQQSQILNNSINLGKVLIDHKMIFITSIIFSVFIYHQNLNSPLLNFSEDSDNLVKLPFVFDLSEAGINDVHLDIVLRPIRMEPRIEDVEMEKNNFGKEGILELHKLMIFNKSIKKISIKSCRIKSEYLYTFLNNLNIFENDNIEELDLSSNYLRSDADEYLVKLISSLRKLKILNLSFNKLECGLGPFFTALKNLYRQKKTKIETLILVNCELDDISFYELGELLKSKYCLIKILCLNENAIPTNSNFFKAIKKNKSLEELYLYGCGITSDKADEIDRIINNTNLESLYLYSNKIHDFNQYIRLIYRLSKIKNENEKKEKDVKYNISCLNNLNLNNAETYNQNSEKIQLIKKGIDKINVVCLDLTSVLKDINSANINFDYYKEVSSLLNDLKKKNDEYKKALNEIFVNEVDKKNYEVRLIGKNTDDLNDLDSFIKDPNSKYHNYIVKIAKHFISEKSFNNKKEEFDRIVNYINLKRVNLILDENKKIKADKKLILV